MSTVTSGSVLMDPQFHVKLLRLYTLSARYIKLTVLYSGVEICVHIKQETCRFIKLCICLSLNTPTNSRFTYKVTDLMVDLTDGPALIWKLEF